MRTSEAREVDVAPHLATRSTWTLQWRHRTPKGALGKVEMAQHLTEYDLGPLITQALAHSCWLYIFDESIDFPGMPRKKESKK